MQVKVKRGEMYFAELSPAVGSEQNGYRPVLILQNAVGNLHSPTVVVAAISGKPKKMNMPTHCYCGRLIRNGWVGALENWMKRQ